MRKILLFSLLFLVAANVRADDPYQLRDPSAVEYLHALLQLPDLSLDDQEILEAEVITRYADDLGQEDYDLVNAAYEVIKGEYLRHEMEAFWLQARVSALLTTQQIALDMTTEFVFEDVPIPVTAFDLNNDGQDEWLLDLQRNEFQGYVVVQRDENQSYRVVSTPLPFEQYQDLMFAPEGVTKASWQIEYVGDVNGDGQPELVTLYTFHNDDYYDIGVTGRYFILTWSDDSLVDIGEDGLSFRLQNLQTTWEWRPVDDSPTLQLRQSRQMRDNWDCYWEQTTIFSWDDYTFIEDLVEGHYPETARCYLRLAENALRAQDYDGAIMNYRQKERLESASDMNTVGDYGAIRLAIALILNGDEEHGIEILRLR